MAIAPIQRQRTDSGLQASIARDALQMVLQEQDARGQIMQKAQAMNQLNLRRQDQNFRDIQKGYFTNRQFGANEEQRGIENQLRQSQEDRLQQKFAADMELQPLREQQLRANIARTNRVASPGSELPDIGAPPVTGRRTFESIDARVSPDGTSLAPRGAAPQTPSGAGGGSAALFPEGSAGTVEESAAPAAEPPRATPVAPSAGAGNPPLVGPPASADPLSYENAPVLPPARRLSEATAAAAQAQQDIQAEQQQAAMQKLQLDPKQQEVAQSLSVFGEKWGNVAAQYFQNGNAEKALEEKREQVRFDTMLEKVEVMGEDFGYGTWDAKTYAPYIKGLSTEDKIMGKIPFQQSAMEAMLTAKRRRDPKVRNLTTADIEMIDKAWPVPDEDEINEKSYALQADAAVLDLQERYRTAETRNQRAIIENVARANDLFGKTEGDRDDVVGAALSELKTEVDPPELEQVRDALLTMRYYEENPPTRSRPLTDSDQDAQRRASITIMEAEDAQMLTPDGRSVRSSAQRRAGRPTGDFSASVAPPAAPSQGGGGARKLLGIGKAADLTK